jgi:hypothetical protein
MSDISIGRERMKKRRSGKKRRRRKKKKKVCREKKSDVKLKHTVVARQLLESWVSVGSNHAASLR